MVLIYIVPLISCKNNKKEIVIQENTLVFNEALNTDYILLNYSDVFDSVKVIPLELSEKSMINSIDQAFYTEEEIIPYHTKSPVLMKIGFDGKIEESFLDDQAIHTAVRYSSSSFYKSDDGIVFF